MKAKGKWLQVRIAEAEKEKFARYARKNKTTMSEIINSFISELLGKK